MQLALRAFVAAASTAVGLLALATPAQAHPLHYGDDASNWESRITSVTPAGSVHAGIGDDVQRITISLGTAREVVVEGDDGKPFLLLRPGGAWVNTRASTPPVWHRVSDSPSWTWHDTRTHWPGYTLPPPVEAAPDRPQRVFDWRIALTADGTPGAVAGTLDWVPGPGGGAGAAIATGAFAGILGLALLTRHTAVIAASLIALVVVDVVHSIGMVAGRVGDLGSRLSALPGHGGLTVALWLFTAGTVYLLYRRREFGLYAAAMLAALFCFTEALPSLGVLWHSHAVNALPIAANRIVIALLTGASVATCAAAVIVIVRSARAPIPGGTT